jgi:hypothetical protein
MEAPAMRDDEPRTFNVDDQLLDPCDERQVQAWAEFYQVSPDVIRETCDLVGPNRMAVELKLAAPRA